MNYKSVFELLLAYAMMAATEAAAATPIWGRSPIAEPYPYVSSGSFNGPAVPASPDPLVRYRWPNPKASDGLEIYLLRPESATCDPAALVRQCQFAVDAHAERNGQRPGNPPRRFRPRERRLV